MQIPSCRNLLVLRNSLASTFSTSKTTATAMTSQVSSFHSTSPTSEKWKNKWKYDVKRTQQPTKNYIRYVTRQKRADTKRALNDLLFHGGYSNASHKIEDPMRNNLEEGWGVDGSDKKQRSKFSARRGGKSHHKKMKRRFRRESFSEDDNHPETIFQATFGNRWYTWSFPGESFSQSSASGFEWRENSDWSNRRKRGWASSSESESEEEEEESGVAGTFSDRKILGLPPGGPLKIEDVKNAFRLSALKWHPDKHQGPSQAMAEEKFKLCVNAYKSLCAALS